jgi:predicted branched-subunit amino acid permease
MTTMQSETDDHGPKPYWSLSGLWQGVRFVLPVLPGAAVFGAAFGAVAAAKGLSFTEAVLMSAIVFAGASQLVAMEIWSSQFTPGTIATLALVTAVVNMRMLLMSASLRPWLGPLPAWQVYPMLTITTDMSWINAIRYRRQGGADASVLLGSSLSVWLVWVPVSAFGFLAGAMIADPRRFGLDLIIPIYFVAMLVPIWPGPRRAIPWVVAGAVALLVERLVPGWWFIICGALAGAVSGGFVDDRK